MPPALHREVKVRTGAQPAVAAVGNHLLLQNPRPKADLGSKGGEVEVAGFQAVEMADAQHSAGTLLGPDSYHRSVCHRPHRRSYRRRVVHPVVRLEVLENGVKAAAETRSDVGVLERAFQERFPGRAAILLEVGDLAGRQLVAKHSLPPYRGSLVLGRQQLAVAQRL